MKLRKTTEDYLKAIYLLRNKEYGVRGVTIAERLGVSKPTVSSTVKRLVNDGYVTMNCDHEIFLTESGERIAVSTLEKHKTLKKLLKRLGIDEQTAEQDACEMEHALSQKSFQALKTLVNNKSIWKESINNDK